jgi:hypothetical protein
VLAEERIEAVDLLKIDVEGAELDVLAGIAGADWPRIRQLVVEVESFAERAAPITAILEEHGFVVTPAQDTVQRAGDFGLVFARAAR